MRCYHASAQRPLPPPIYLLLPRVSRAALSARAIVSRRARRRGRIVAYGLKQNKLSADYRVGPISRATMPHMPSFDDKRCDFHSDISRCSNIEAAELLIG